MAFNSTTEDQVYVLVDSWYTSRKLIEECSRKGFHLIGGIRATRKTYPVGIGIRITEFTSEYIQYSDLHSVTVGRHEY